MEDHYSTTEPIRARDERRDDIFFSTIYIQYHINRLAKYKKTGVLS